MAAMTEKAIHLSIEALKMRDKQITQSVIDNDQQIDEMELKIEETAIDLLALRQPLAIDLRFITTGMKMNAELERIADLAVNICQRVLALVNEPYVKPLIDIPKLADIAVHMVKNAIDAFVRHDENLAKEVIFSDKDANKLRNMVQDELIEFLVKDGTIAPRAIPLLLIARHLERICDHATNMAEDIIYMVQAKVVKHRLSKLENDRNAS